MTLIKLLSILVFLLFSAQNKGYFCAISRSRETRVEDCEVLEQKNCDRAKNALGLTSKESGAAAVSQLKNSNSFRLSCSALV